MKQVIRMNTFETNSSSYHTLIIMNKEDYDKFLNGETYFCPSGDKQFISNKDIPNFDDFKTEYSDFNLLNDYSKEQAIESFKADYFDTDYALAYSSDYLECPTEVVYNKNGDEKVAVSIYIGEC